MTAEDQATKTNCPGGAALSDVRVVDLTTVVFGPSATQILADYGADVIKVESPAGDSTRMTGPSRENGMASLFLGSNRNKRSIVLDLKTASGRKSLLDLVDTADIFVHNILPQKLESLGLSPDVLRGRNPRLIYMGLHGFGEAGPYAGKPAYDDIIQSLSGAVDLCERQAGVPRYLPTIAADKIAGQMAAHAALAALYQRERTGRGQFVEVPMFECMVQFLMIEHFNARHFADLDAAVPARPGEFGYQRTMAEWRRPYRAADGYVCLMPYNDRDWARLFEDVGRPDLAADPKFVSIGERTKHIGELYKLLEEIVATRTVTEWLAAGDRLGIACSTVNAMSDLEADPHLADVRLFGLLPTGADWQFRFVRSPVRLAESYVEPRVPPRLGQHTEEILSEVGASLAARPVSS